MHVDPQHDWRRVRRALCACDLAILALLMALPCFWLLDPVRVDLGILTFSLPWGRRVLALYLGVLGFRVALAAALGRIRVTAAGLWRRKPFPQLVLSLGSLYLVFAACEGLLIRRGFAANLPPVIFEGRDAQGGKIIVDTLPDPELMWKFKPGGHFHGRTINRMGFREREVEWRKPPGVRRVVCMGDSVTGQGWPGYAEILHHMTQTNPPTAGRWECFNIAVHGYCVLQGLRLFEQCGASLQPDYVTIFFGWNDHWLDHKPYSQQMAVHMGPAQGLLYEKLRKSRTFSFLVVALNPNTPLRQTREKRVYRVPPAEYRDALARLVNRIRAAGAVPVLITAPRSRLTEELLHKTYATSIEQAERIHDDYVELTRQVAREQQAPLLDLAAILKGDENGRLFAPDGIHFDFYPHEGRMTNNPSSQPGLERVAAELHGFLRTLPPDR